MARWGQGHFLPPEPAGQIRNSGVYGLDTAAAVGRGQVDDRGRILPGALRAMWDDVAPNFAQSRARIRFTNDVTMGKVKGPVPRKKSRNARIFTPLLPQQILRPTHNHNVLTRREPKLKRFTSGIANAPLERATRIEQWVDPFTRRLVSWDQLTGMVQDEAELGALVVPAGADWIRTPPPWSASNDPNDTDPLPEWWRDGDGRGLGDDEYKGKEHELAYKRSGRKTREAYEEALADWELENPPIRVRLVHAEDCVPIGLSIDGDGPKVQGLLIRSLYSRNELIRRAFRWGDGPLLEQMSNSGPRDVELFEGWMTDASGLPYVVYSVQGMATRWSDGMDSDWAMIDLSQPRFGGQTRLHAHYEYGWWRAVRDPDMRSIPFSFGMAGADLASQSMIGAAIANFWNRGHGSRGIVPNKDAPRDAYMDGSNPRKIAWEPGGDLPVLPGEVVDMLPQVISPDAWKVLDVLSGLNAQEGPPPGAYGGPGPESGRERTVIRRHIEDSQAQILAGSLRMWQKIGMSVLELAAGMTKHKVCKPIRVATQVPIATDGKGNQRKGLIVALDPHDVQGNYGLKAYFQPQPGDNLALAEQAKGLVEAGLRPRRWFHEEIMGDESPEQTEAEIVSDHMVYDEEGQADIRDLAMRLRNDERKRELDMLRQQGAVSPSGAPLSMAGGLAGPPDVGAAGGAPMVPAAAGVPIGVSNPSSAQGMLGAQVAAGMQTGPIRGDEIALQQGGPG